MDTFFFLIVLIFSVVIHEVSHGYVADHLGDPTARLAGRLTLNPIPHIDIFGSILLPTLLIITGSPFLFGWAKPVPYNPNMLSDPKRGAAKIAAAGPISNFTIALAFGLFIRFAGTSLGSFLLPVVPLFAIIVVLNIVLGVFNLVPIPPLDGSKVLFALLPPTEQSRRLVFTFERYGFFLVIIFILFAFPIIYPIIRWLFYLFAGVPLAL
jgi:Zn-dependent protease